MIRRGLMDPEIPPTPYQEFKAGYVSPVASFFSEMFRDFWSVVRDDWLGMLSWLMGMSVALYLMFRFVRPKVVDGVYYLRGVDLIRGEAMVTGSPIRPNSEVPNFQVSIYKPGVFLDTFVGYGVRVKEVLVAPAHVLQAAAVSGQFMVKTRTSSMLLPNMTIPSGKISDVLYQVLSRDVWAKLGTPTVSIVRVSDRPVSVSITGPEGRANGYATKSTMPHILLFTGSTIPGFSGAVYVNNGAGYGMHLGVSNDGNIGVALESLNYEIGQLITGERRQIPVDTRTISSSEDSVQGASNRGKRVKDWSPKQITEQEDDLFEQYAQDVQARDYSFDEWLSRRPSKKSNPGHRGDALVSDDLNGLSIFELQNIVSAATSRMNLLQSSRAVASTSFTPQSDEAVFEEILRVSEDPLDELRTLVLPIVNEWPVVKARLAALEGNAPLRQPSQTVNQFPCSECGRSFKSSVGRVVHKMAKHPVEGESAIPQHHDENEKIQVKPTVFLDRTRSSALKSKSSSHSVSKPSPNGSRSSFALKNQLPANDIQTILDQFSAKLLKAISGPKGEQEQ